MTWLEFAWTFKSRTPSALKGYRCKEWSSPLTEGRGRGRGSWIFFFWTCWGIGGCRRYGGIGMLNERKGKGKEQR